MQMQMLMIHIKAKFHFIYTLPKEALMVEACIRYVLMHFKMFNNMAANRK